MFKQLLFLYWAATSLSVFKPVSLLPHLPRPRKSNLPLFSTVSLLFHRHSTFPTLLSLFSLYFLFLNNQLNSFTLFSHFPYYPFTITHHSTFSSRFNNAFSFTLHMYSFFLLRLILLPTSSALRSCSTGDSLLSSAFIRSAKSAPALAPPIPVLLHHHHPLLPPLADQLAGTHFLHYPSSRLPSSPELLL